MSERLIKVFFNLALVFILIFSVSSVKTAPDSNKKSVKEKRRERFKKVTRSLVHISTRSGTGSGFFITKNLIMTNAHVVGKAKRPKCMLYNKQTVTGKTIGYDVAFDIALIRIDLEDLDDESYPYVLPIAKDNDVFPGDVVYAMGSPYGESRTISKGIVSNIDRYLPPMGMTEGRLSGQFNHFIQTDAGINPGNSGGPLIDTLGKLIAVNSRKMMYADDVGYSIPVKFAMEAMKKILKAEKNKIEIKHYVLGVELKPHDPDNSRYAYGYIADFGVKVGIVFTDLPTKELKKNDIITHINGVEIHCKTNDALPAFYHLVDKTYAKTKKELTIKLFRKKEEMEIKYTPINPVDYNESVRVQQWGVYVRKPYSIEQRHNRGGVVTFIIKAYNPFQFEKGDLILKVGLIPLKSFGHLIDISRESRQMDMTTTFEVLRDDKEVILKINDLSSLLK